MTHDPLLLDASVHAPGWPELAQILSPTLTIDISSGWAVVLPIALWVWLDRMRR
jgi:hypothetical protein